MTLVNPTDDELNRAFAERVAGWKWRDERGGAWFDKSDDPDPMKWVRIIGPNGGDIALDGGLRWVSSADAVIPWLQNMWLSVVISEVIAGWAVRICYRGDQSFERPLGHCDSWALDPSFPRAAVIALLRAHGVEVEIK